MSFEYFVSPAGSDKNPGTAKEPFATIGRAAQAARPGDTVTVGAGTYREWVKPERGGLSDTRRITYQAAPGEKVVIKGSEQITGWQLLEGSTWRVSVPNALFGDYNPFAEELVGDWVVYEDKPITHLADVYLGGMSFFEAHSVDEVLTAAERTEDVDHWTGVTEAFRNVAQTKFRWYAEVGDDETVIWANFHGANPNEELVEVNVRRSVFYPVKNHLDYITVRGFEMAQAATPWTPPTADQPGLVGPNWAKGWIIEDNIVHDSKCSGISIGKEGSTGHNFFTDRGDKPGYQYQLESVFTAREFGWDREHIGSHIVRGNTIYDCGQNGIVGHLGCVFSTIENNHIYNIAIKREYYGYEIGGIKLHAAIDVTIANNRIHDCSLGTWLDWETQGTRVTRNAYYNNTRDIFIEVSHGPYVVDNNVFASRASIESMSQGGAYINNLIAGTIRLQPVMDRATPYHHPHTTQVKGFAIIYGGDDRFIGNVFLGGDGQPAYTEAGEGNPETCHGTSIYDSFPPSFEEYLRRLDEQPESDHEKYFAVRQPAYIRDNVYLGGASAYQFEEGAVVVPADPDVAIVEDGDEVYLTMTVPAEAAEKALATVTTADLPRARFVDADFEDRSGGILVVDRDITGAVRRLGDSYPAGPFAQLTPGAARLRLW